MPEQLDTAPPQAATFPRLILQALGAGALFFFALALNHTACWGLFVLAALIAWPLWVYRNEVILFERRMVLEHLTRADSGVQRWLWAGTLTRGLASACRGRLAGRSVSKAALVFHPELDGCGRGGALAGSIAETLAGSPSEQPNA
jgi:hypothetical protein